MITRYTYKNLVWIDLATPTQEEVRELMQEFSIDPLVAEELLLPTLKPRVEQYEHSIYAILHFPSFKHSHTASKNQEVDFVIGKNFIITTRYDMVDPLHKFSKVFEVNSILDKSNLGEHAGFIFFYMLKKLYRAVEHELAYISDELKKIEDRMFSGEERAMVREISNVSRELLNFKQALYAHRDMLDSFRDASTRFFGDSFKHHAQSLTGEYLRVWREVEANTEFVYELRETNNSLVSTSQNEIMKILTIMAFVTFPLSLIAGIFGMNTVNMPIVGHKYDFWIIVSVMAIATMFFFAYFKHKRWL